MSVARTSILVGMAAVTGLSLVALPAAAEPAQRQVPAPNGRYGDLFGTEGMLFKVRHRTIIDPQVMLTVECQHSDGTSSQVAFGPTTSDASRRFRIPRNGNGRFSWTEETDGSLLDNAEVEIGYTFRAHRTTLASVLVTASYSETDPDGTRWTSDCRGEMPFRLTWGPLQPGR